MSGSGWRAGLWTSLVEKQYQRLVRFGSIMFDLALVGRVCTGGVFSGCVVLLRACCKLPGHPTISAMCLLICPLLPSTRSSPQFPFFPLHPSLFTDVSFLDSGERSIFFNGLDKEDLSFCFKRRFLGLNFLIFESKSSDRNKRGSGLPWWSSG